MGKKYKGKICVYCSEALSTEPDHVFAREFFLEADRNNLPMVPTCRNCNSEKSRLEHYLTVLLPFGGRHYVARDNLERVRGRLAKNIGLHKRLAESWGDAFFLKDGVPIPIKTLAFEGQQMVKLFSLIVRGLVSLESISDPRAFR